MRKIKDNLSSDVSACTICKLSSIKELPGCHFESDKPTMCRVNSKEKAASQIAFGVIYQTFAPILLVYQQVPGIRELLVLLDDASMFFAGS